MSLRPLRVAHRGMPQRAPENTLPSFAAALEAGAQGIELDVHVTSDGVVVVHHDPVTADGQVIARTSLSALRRSARGGAIAIPTLHEVATLVAGRAELFVEAKGAGVEVGVLDVLRHYDGPAAIHGFDHAQIGRIRMLDPAIRLGILLEREPANLLAALGAAGATDVWPHWRLATSRLVRKAQQHGCRVIPWTVNDPAIARALAELGVDGICTDDVSMLE